MGYIKLKELIVSGENVTTSTIEFGPKLTIIAGPSDTGKSCIFRCIDYVLGASNKAENIPLDPVDGYDTITLVLETHKGIIKLTRINKDTVTNVETNIEGIESGEYVLTPQKKNTKTINDLLLNIIDAPQDLKLPSSEDGKPASFTWRTIKQAFIFDEERADKAKSILLPLHGQPLFIASLIFFMTDNNLAEYKDDKEGQTIKKAKRKAIIGYIKEHKTELLKKKKSFEDKLSALTENGKTIEDKIAELNQQLHETNLIIDGISNESRNLTIEMIEVETRLNKNKSLLSKYDDLQTQYDTDISRLSFIVENESLIKKSVRKTKCPFCDSEVTPHDHTSYIEASQAELVKVINNNNDLQELRLELIDAIEDDEALIIDYQESIHEFKNQLNTNLIPQRNQIISILQSYTEYIQTIGILDYMNSNDDELEKDIQKYENEESNDLIPFKAKEMLFELLKDTIHIYAKDILTAVGYTNINSVEFDEKTMDLIINNKRKINRGKGYKAFTNSILLLAFEKYISEHSARNTHFFIFDSPLKGLDLGESVDDTQNIRKGYFQYLIDLETEDQIIIFENTKYHELPELQVNETTKIYKFTQKENEGRYGFLMDVRKA